MSEMSEVTAMATSLVEECALRDRHLQEGHLATNDLKAAYIRVPLSASPVSVFSSVSPTASPSARGTPSPPSTASLRSVPDRAALLALVCRPLVRRLLRRRSRARRGPRRPMLRSIVRGDGVRAGSHRKSALVVSAAVSSSWRPNHRECRTCSRKWMARSISSRPPYRQGRLRGEHLVWQGRPRVVWLMVAEARAAMWCDRVESKNNSADGPSRSDTELVENIGGIKVIADIAFLPTSRSGSVPWDVDIDVRGMLMSTPIQPARPPRVDALCVGVSLAYHVGELTQVMCYIFPTLKR